MQILHIGNRCSWLVHILCKCLKWNYKNCLAQPWLSFGILQVLQWSNQVSFLLTDTEVCFKFFQIFTISNFWKDVFIYLFFSKNCLDFWIFYHFGFFSFYLWLMIHLNGKWFRISLYYLGLKKKANNLLTTFSNALLNKMFHESFFLGVQLANCQHWCWTGATSHYLSQWWPSPLVHILSSI